MNEFAEYGVELLLVTWFGCVELDQSFFDGEEEVFDKLVVLDLLFVSDKTIIDAHYLLLQSIIHHSNSFIIIIDLILKINHLNLQMQSASKIQSLAVHLITHPHIHHPTRIFLHILAALQIIVSIVPQQSHIYIILHWLDPSTFVQPTILAASALLTMSILVALVLWKLVTGVGDAQKVSIEQQYVSNLILHLQLVLRSILYVPLLKISISTLVNGEENSFYVISIVNMAFFLILILPFHLVLQFNTFLFVKRTDNTLHYISAHLLFNIFRLIIAALKPLPQNQYIIAPIITFIVLYLFIIFRQPVACYHHDPIMQHPVSWFCSIAIFYLAQKIEASGASWPALYVIIGTASFGFLIQAICEIRVKKILELQDPNPQQIKTLLYLMSNGKKYTQKLQYFILRHRKFCALPSCRCKKVIKSISEDGSQCSWNNEVWFQFLGELLKRCFCLQQMKASPQSKMRQRLSEYEQVVGDLAQVYLFKLNRVNEAFTIIHNFKHFTEARSISYFTFRVKHSAIVTLINQSTHAKFNTEGQHTNLEANKYLDFQQTSQKYRKNLLRCCKHMVDFWQEMNKRQPDEDKIKVLLRVVQKSNLGIRKLYLQIVEHFKNSSQILDFITKAYFLLVLNIPEKSKFHVIKSQDIIKYPSKLDPKSSTIEENLRYFSYNRQTPICLVSLNSQDFGLIVSSNHYFNETLLFSGVGSVNIDEFMLGQFRQAHAQKIRSFMLQDEYNYQHEHSLILNGDKLVYCKILVQIVPSLLEGLRYAIFLRDYEPGKKIFCVRNKAQIKYTSESFDKCHECQHQQIFLKFVQTNPFQAKNKGKNDQVLFQNQQWKIYFKLISKVTINSGQYLFIEVLDDVESNIQILTRTSFNTKTSFYTMHSQLKLQLRSKDQALAHNQNNNIEQQSTLSNGMCLSGKKGEDMIFDSYSRIVNDDKQCLLRKMMLLSMVLILGLLICSTSIVILKQVNRQSYMKGLQINTNYHYLIMNISKSIAWLHDTNYWLHQNNTANAQIQFSSFVKIQDINTVLDNAVKFFNLDDLVQQWTTFSCITNDPQWKVSIANNFLAFFDFYQNQLNKLNKAQLADYLFGPSKRFTTLPLSAHQCNYWELTTNSLYSHLPSFRRLKKGIIQNEIQGKINRSLPIIMILVNIILICCLFVAAKVIKKKKIVMIENESYAFLQRLKKGVVMEKEATCRQFLSRYCVKESKTSKGSGFMQKDAVIQEMQNESNVFHIINKSLSFNYDRIIDSQTERELQSQLKKLESLQPKQAQESQILEPKPVIRKKTSLFSKPTLHRVACRYTLIVLPFVLLSVGFIICQISESKTILSVIEIQQKFQSVNSNLNLMRIYAQLYGIHDSSMDVYLNVEDHLRELIVEVFAIEREVINRRLQFESVPQLNSLLEKIGYGNLCDFISSNVTAYIFSEKNYSTCMALNNHILSKGLYSLIVNYIGNLNDNLLFLNPSVQNYTRQQQIDYLSEAFFTSKRVLLPYFDELFVHLLTVLGEDYGKRVNTMTGAYVAVFIAIFVCSVLLVILAQRCNNARLGRQLTELKSIWQVVSFETIVRKQQLKREYLSQIELFNELQ